MQEELQQTEERKPGAKAALKLIVFAAIVLGIFAYLNLAVVFKGTAQTKGAFEGLYALENDTVDVMYIGSSAASRYYIGPMSFHEEGIAGFTLGPNGSPLYFVKHLIAETEKTQSPQLYVIELRSTTHEPDELPEGQMRNTLDMIDLLSVNRVKMAADYLAYNPKSKTDMLQLLVPIIKYHPRMLDSDMDSDDFLLKYPVNRSMGYAMSKVTLTQSPQDTIPYSEKTGELSEATLQVLDDLLDYCEGLDAEVLFVMSPYEPTKKQAGILNAVEAHVTERGFAVANFNHAETFEDIGLDWSTDFYNHHHTNYLGAEKYTKYFTEYLASHYDLPDHRGDPKYQSWEDAYQAYLDYVSEGIKYYNNEKDE